MLRDYMLNLRWIIWKKNETDRRCRQQEEKPFRRARTEEKKIKTRYKMSYK